MSASDDFPRGAYLDSGYIGGGGGQAASVQFSLAPNICWTLTSVNATAVVIASGGSGIFAPLVTATCQGETITLGLLVISAVTVGESATFSWTGQITFPPGGTVTVAVSAANGFTAQDLNATAQPV